MSMSISFLLLICAFFSLPTAALVWFLVSLILYLRQPKPRQRKGMLIASAITAGVVIALVASLLGIFLFGIAYM